MPWIPVTEVEEFLRENNLLRKPGPCPDCGVQPEQMHTVGCDIEKCSVCGHQRISCACPRNGWHDRGFARWTGFPPGELEAIALGAVVRYVPDPENPVPVDVLGVSEPISSPELIARFREMFFVKPSQPETAEGSPASPPANVEASQTEEPFTLLELLNLANEGYTDGFLSQYYNAKTGNAKRGQGDRLAEFIVVELRQTFDEQASREDQIAEVHRVLNNAIRDLDHVIGVVK